MTVRDMVKVYKMLSSNQPSVVGNVFRLAAKKPALVVLVVCIASLYTAAVTGNPYIPPIEYAKFWHGNASVNADLVPISFEVDDSASLMQKFSQFNYDLSAITEGERDVPRLFLSTLSHDLSATSVSERKRLFVQAILPLILRANEVILMERQRVRAIATQARITGEISDDSKVWLEDLASVYGVAPNNFQALLERVDKVPPSLALAQAVEESGWGTSRFAREGNAVFGERTFTTGRGLVPEQRDAGKQHEVRVFDGLHFSVSTYMLNLNSHWAYETFRKARSEMRLQDESLDGYKLATTLGRYSERGTDYIATIRSIIRANGFDLLDDVTLAFTRRSL